MASAAEHVFGSSGNPMYFRWIRSMTLYQDSPDAMLKIVVYLVLLTIDAAAADINPFA